MTVVLPLNLRIALSAALPLEGSEEHLVNVLNGSTTVATLSVPRHGIKASEIAVLINDADPQSVEVAAYYQTKRGIPAANMIHLSFDNSDLVNHGMLDTDFATLKPQVDAAVGPNIQAFVISWTNPYRITQLKFIGGSWATVFTNYSVTSAFTYGINPAWLPLDASFTIPAMPYYNTTSTKPYTNYSVRPTMQLAGTSAANVKAMIDRSVAADRTFPTGDGYLVRTSDTDRSIRIGDFATTAAAWDSPPSLNILYVTLEELNGYNNVLFYMTGQANLFYLDTNTYTLGAVGDTLTSTSGELLPSSGGQTSILRFIEAGCSASYGTHTEPFALLIKFPVASILIKNYFMGNTIGEAYLKSVSWAIQGVFVGDPLTRPWGAKATLVGGTLTVTTTSLVPGTDYNLYSAPSSAGPFTQIATVSIPDYQFAEVIVPSMSAPYYKLEVAAK